MAPNKREFYLTAKNAQWFVFCESRSDHKIEKFNVFMNWPFRESCETLLRKNITKEKFAEELRHELMFRFWAKYEYEVTITSWPEREGFIESKIDVADQVLMNYQAFIDYIWTYLRPIARQRKKKPEQ